MSDRLTTDRNDPRLTHGINETRVPMAEAYLVLSKEERAKGWVRPFRDKYVHVGASGPTHRLRDLTPEDEERFGGSDYVKYEEYPLTAGGSALGRFWTQAQLDNIGKGCGAVTTMGRDLSETYAREPHFYGATYCAGCHMHRPVDEFTWDVDGDRVGS